MPAAGLICGQQAGPTSCTDPVHCRGLCRRHYRRLSRGGSIDPAEPALGDPSGHGRYGLLDPDPLDPGRLICHDCGRSYMALGVHIGMAHDDTHPGGVRDYRLRHGLPMSASLTTTALNAALAEAVRTSTDRLEGVRTPATLADVPQGHISRGLRLAAARRR